LGVIIKVKLLFCHFDKGQLGRFAQTVETIASKMHKMQCNCAELAGVIPQNDKVNNFYHIMLKILTSKSY
jgi:hypothetical protein